METPSNKSRAFVDLPTMEGAQLLLRPLTLQDSEALYQAASDPLIWEQYPDALEVAIGFTFIVRSHWGALLSRNS